jgi:DNA-binding GntR family transcriptional regulator
MALKQPIARVALPDQVYEILRERIFDRVFVPDEKLNIEALARELRVSATPVREALSRLSAEGLVKIAPYVGAKVAPIPSLEHYRQIYDLRLVLEPWAASEAAKRKDPVALAEMSMALQAMEATELAKRYRRFKTFSDADEAFHRAIFKGARNEPALKTFVDLNTHLHLARLYIDRNHFTEEARQFHIAIFESIQAGRHQAAYRQMREHLQRSKLRLLGEP